MDDRSPDDDDDDDKESRQPTNPYKTLMGQLYGWLHELPVRNVRLLRKVVEQVEQVQTRYADALLEHVYAALLIEGKLSVDGLCKGNHVSIVVPDEKVSQNRYAVIATGHLTTDVFLVGNTLVLQSTEEGLFRWKSGVVESRQTIHVLLREMTFRHLATVRFQILLVAESRGYVIGHV